MEVCLLEVSGSESELVVAVVADKHSSVSMRRCDVLILPVSGFAKE